MIEIIDKIEALRKEQPYTKLIAQTEKVLIEVQKLNEVWQGIETISLDANDGKHILDQAIQNIKMDKYLAVFITTIFNEMIIIEKTPRKFLNSIEVQKFKSCEKAKEVDQEAFLEFCKRAKNHFVISFLQSEVQDNIDLRVKSEDFIIAFDQVIERYKNSFSISTNKPAPNVIQSFECIGTGELYPQDSDSKEFNLED